METCDFDPGPGITELTPVGIDDIFLLKLTNDGNFLWVRSWGGLGSDGGGHAVEVDSAGNSYVTGHWRETTDFDPGPGEMILTSNGYDDAFVTSFDPEGNFRWVRTWGGPLSDIGYGMCVDDSGMVYIVGELDSELGWEPNIGDWTAIGFGDIFIRGYDTSGNLTGEEVFAGSGWGRIHMADTDADGNIHMTGFFKGEMDFEPGTGIDLHTSNGEEDVFLLMMKAESLN